MKDPNHPRHSNTLWIVLIAGLALLCILALVLFAFLQKPGGVVRIYQNGELLQELPLDEDAQVTIPSQNGGFNTVAIQDGAVRMLAADCAGQDCVQHTPVRKTLERIVCLPHQLVIQVEETGAANPVMGESP